MYLDLFNSFFPVTYSFSRPFYESLGHYAIQKDGVVYIAINMLGIAKDNIEVSVENDPTRKYQHILTVKGKTYNELLDKEFAVTWRKGSLESIASVDYYIENGLLILEVKFEEPVKPSVKITAK